MLIDFSQEHIVTLYKLVCSLILCVLSIIREQTLLGFFHYNVSSYQCIITQILTETRNRTAVSEDEFSDLDNDDELQNVTLTTRGKPRGRGRGTGTRGGRGKTPSTRGRGKARGSKSQVVETTQKSIQSCKQSFSFFLILEVAPF